jgi:hypothetical protein
VKTNLAAPALAGQDAFSGDRAALLCVGVFTLLGIFANVPWLWYLVLAMQSDGLAPYLTNIDFANYWMAGRMVLAGEQQMLFTQDIYFARLQEMFGADYPVHNWGYPPHTLLLLWPLGWLDYKSGLVVFLVVTFVMFVFSVIAFRRAYAPQSDWRILALALTGYVLMMVHLGQNGMLTSALLLFGLAAMRRHSLLAGIAFALLTIKPQLGFLLPVLLALERNWKVIGWTVVFAAALVVLSIALFGVASWTAYLTETLAYQRTVLTDWVGDFIAMMPTVFGSMRALGFSPDVAYLVQWPVTIAAGVSIAWLLWKETDPLRRIFIVVCGTFVISPYAFNYDMGALGAVAAMLVGSQALSRPALISISIVAAISPAVLNLGRAGLPITPLLLMFSVLALALDSKARAAANPPPLAAASA